MKKNYSELLKDPRWQKRRLEIMKRDKFKCKLCGDEETTLQVHHKEYVNGNNPWEYNNDQLITLCEHCHFEIELLKNHNELQFEFKNISIYKSTGWEDGSRIMFIAIPSLCVMRIYDQDNNYINGYKLEWMIPDIIKILKKAQNG